MVEPQQGPRGRVQPLVRARPLLLGVHGRRVAVRRRPLRRHQATEGPALPGASAMTPDPLTGSYLAMYWVLEGKHDEWNRWAVEQVKWLHANGRMFAERAPHPHAAVRRQRWAHRATDGSCTIELALDHNYPGLVVVAGDVAEGHTHAEVDAWFRETTCPTPWRSRGVPTSSSTRPRCRCSTTRPADVPPPRGRTQPVPAAALPRPRSRGGLGRRLRQDRRGDRTTAAWPPTCGPARSSRPTSARTSTPTSSAIEARDMEQLTGKRILVTGVTGWSPGRWPRRWPRTTRSTAPRASPTPRSGARTRGRGGVTRSASTSAAARSTRSPPTSTTSPLRGGEDQRLRADPRRQRRRRRAPDGTVRASTRSSTAARAACTRSRTTTT